MDVAGFYYLEGGLLFGFLVAAGLTVVSLNRPAYRVARRCAWAAAILFGSIAVVWGVSTMEPAWIRLPAVGIAGLVAAISLTEALRFIKNHEFPSQPAVVSNAPVSRGPTLEATNKSKIDATEAVIPGDLPFQFGRADNNSVIDMPGIVVTRQNDGTLLVTPPTHINRQFPPATGEFSGLSAQELAQRMRTTATDLRQLQQDYNAASSELIQRAAGDTNKLHEWWPPMADKYTAIWDNKFAQPTLSIASEALARVGSVSSDSRAFVLGAGTVLNGKFAGPNPAGEAADFLDELAAELTRRAQH
jgi:hypothetical protein